MAQTVRLFLAGLGVIIIGVIQTSPAADEAKSPVAEVRIDADGTVHTPPLDVPLSAYMSEQTKRAFIEEAFHVSDADTLKGASISKIRKYIDSKQQEMVDRARAIYPVNIEQKLVAGVATRVITPLHGVAESNRGRVLINLHGGGFSVGAGNEALLESIPIAGFGKFKVISVDYREGPEFKFPSASQDVAAVYRVLLKEYRSRNIGIYGCSAGGTLTAMAVAWLQKENMAKPGAIGIFSAGAFAGFSTAPEAIGAWGGDSRFTTPPLVGEKSPPVHPKPALAVPTDVPAYLSTANLADPLVSPALSAAVLAKFPPTLLITGTRAYDMSAAVQTQRLLTKAGVNADLHLWDGLGHCFILDADFPESQEAFAVITHFFDTHLGHHD
jgi:monoterpene epsilon-lactone hydrolase